MNHKRNALAGLGLAMALATPVNLAFAQEQPPKEQPPKEAPPKEAPPKPGDPKAEEPKPAPKPTDPQKPRREQGPQKGAPDSERKAPEPKSEPKPASKPAPAPEPKAAPKPAPEPQPAPKPAPAPEQKAAPKPAPEPQSAPKPTPAPEQRRPADTQPPVQNPAQNPSKPQDQPKAASPSPTPAPDSGPVPKSVPAPTPPAATPPAQTAPQQIPKSGAIPAPAQPATAQKSATPAAPTGGAALPAAPAAPATPQGAAATAAFTPGFQPVGPAPQKLQDVKQGRTEQVQDDGKTKIIHETDNRVIIQQNNTTIIRHDETQRLAKSATNVSSQQRSDGTTQTVIVQPGGIQIFNIVDNSGRLVRRYRHDERGQDVDIIDNRSFYRNAAVIGAGLVVGAVVLGLAAPEVHIAREKYIVDYERASDDDIYETLTAPPIERLERRYSLDEVRYSHELRERMRRIDLDAVTFSSGSWEVADDEFSKLERVAQVLNRVIDRHPSEVFLIEGHTDAVGSDVDNLTLSDRRAQAVAEILTGVFRVPAENLVTQGYGEQYLKVQTQGAERANRRVAVRRITPLMSENHRRDD